jgi:hypothetical protein
MITAVRLRAPDQRKNWMLKTFVSKARRAYRAPLGQDPGALHIVEDPEELETLRQIPQFEIHTFPDRMAMDAHVQSEMEARVRAGGAPVRAAIEDAVPAKKPEPDNAQRVKAVLPEKDASDAEAAPVTPATPEPGMRQPEVSAEGSQTVRRAGGGRRPAPR